ncbi:MAG: TerB family tellurite resistance protein [Rhizobiaceae bacterium]
MIKQLRPSMLSTIKKFVTELNSADDQDDFIHSDLQLAEAALMYHVIAVDGVVKADEKKRMAEVLARHFDLDETETGNLTRDARNAENEAIDLYKFTSILKHTLTIEERNLIIEHLWEMVFADGVVHELEDNVVWRVAELLGVDSRERMVLKQKVWKRRSEETGRN